MSAHEDGGAAMRAAFEKWMSDDGEWPEAISRKANGDYAVLSAASCWSAWQAAWRLVSGDMSADVQNEVAARDGYRADAAALRAALEPFTEHCSSDETITITVRTEDVRRARAALSRASGSEADHG